MGQVKGLRREGSNLHISIKAPFASELQIDQSVAHNGVCLTVVELLEDGYTVTAIDETLQKTNLGQLREGDFVNLERCLRADSRFDGHIVQGHVDGTAACTAVEDQNGSWLYTFRHPSSPTHLTVEKGSICVNGISLTVVNSGTDSFSVAIIPYTHAHTNLQYLKTGDTANLEFDIIGKYVAKMLEARGL
ncbi:riboflavin synthase [soil metagenome]